MRKAGSSVREHAARPAGPSTVFVVDDDISMRESLELLIATAGFQPLIFATGHEFLARAPVSSPSCLILDVTLPDLNGLELQRRLATQQQVMPIIFITGYGDIPMSVRAMKAGAAEFLTKPFSDDVLLGAVAHALEQSREAVGEQAALQTLRGNYASLTRREREVMSLVVSGL